MKTKYKHFLLKKCIPPRFTSLLLKLYYYWLLMSLRSSLLVLMRATKVVLYWSTAACQYRDLYDQMWTCLYLLYFWVIERYGPSTMPILGTDSLLWSSFVWWALWNPLESDPVILPGVALPRTGSGLTPYREWPYPIPRVALPRSYRPISLLPRVLLDLYSCSWVRPYNSLFHYAVLIWLMYMFSYLGGTQYIPLTSWFLWTRRSVLLN